MKNKEDYSKQDLIEMLEYYERLNLRALKRINRLETAFDKVKDSLSEVSKELDVNTSYSKAFDKLDDEALIESSKRAVRKDYEKSKLRRIKGKE